MLYLSAQQDVRRLLFAIKSNKLNPRSRSGVGVESEKENRYFLTLLGRSTRQRNRRRLRPNASSICSYPLTEFNSNLAPHSHY
jgi:hypothetical protein